MLRKDRRRNAGCQYNNIFMTTLSEGSTYFLKQLKVLERHEYKNSTSNWAQLTVHACTKCAHTVFEKG